MQPIPEELAPRDYIRIEPSRGWVRLRLDELWRYRELLLFLTLRDISVRYKQTIFGVLWAVMNPVLHMVLFTVLFSKVAKLPSEGIPYPIFSFAALVPWTFFSAGLSKAANSLVMGARLLKKVYFPRLAMPIAAVFGSGIEFLIAFAILGLMMVYYGIVPTIHVVWLPFFILIALATALGASLWLSAMNVQFRDIKNSITFIVQFWLYATPIAYSSTLIQDPLLKALYAMNPMVAVVDGFRWALLGTTQSPNWTTVISVLSAALLLFSGLFYFRRMERTFADVV